MNLGDEDELTDEEFHAQLSMDIRSNTKRGSKCLEI